MGGGLPDSIPFDVMLADVVPDGDEDADLAEAEDVAETENVELISAVDIAKR